MNGIVHLTGPVEVLRDADAQFCAFCGAEVPGRRPLPSDEPTPWPQDVLITVVGDAAVQGAEPGAIRCSAALMREDDGA